MSAERILVIYHSADFDGIACREIARRFLGMQAVYLGWDYGQPVPDVFGFTTIYMLDISVKGLMNHPGLIWIDHHAPAIAEYSPAIPGDRQDGVAACRLTWQWFSELDKPAREAYVARTVNEPVAVRLIGEYDIWDKRDPNADLFQHGLRSQLEIDWPRLLRDESDYLDELFKGAPYVANAAREAQAWLMRTLAFDLRWEGLVFLAANALRLSSAAYESALKPEHDACISFAWLPSIGRWKVSMRGVPSKPDLDLSMIAKRFVGGGGHKQACGFECLVLPWMADHRDSDIKQLREQIRQLETALHADASRLNWLESSPLAADIHGGAEDGGRAKVWAISCHPSVSLREAIDAARMKPIPA